MENLLGQDDKEYMKMAMLKHEETFREQVYELHRLYRIQKTLMQSLESSSRHHGNVMHQNSSIRFDLERPAEEILHNNINVAESDHAGDRTMSEVIEESEIELTLGPTTYTPRKKHSEYSGPSSFSSSSTESSDMNRTSNSISRHKTSITREKHPWLVQVLSMNMT